MKALSAEASILEGKTKVKELFEYVSENAKTKRAHEMEAEIFKRIMNGIGYKAMECYFAANGIGDVGEEFISKDGTVLKKESTLRSRNYFSIFGKIKVPRAYYYGGCGVTGIIPLDAQVDFPKRCYSYLLQEWMSMLSTRDAYKETEKTLTKLLGLNVNSSRCEIVSEDNSINYEEFYKEKAIPSPESEGEINVIQFDGKGVPVIKEEAVKLKGRQGKGEKRQKKKEAMVGVSYTVDKNKRTAEEVARNLIYPEESKRKKSEQKKKGVESPKPPRACNIRRLASLEKSKEEVVKIISDDTKSRRSNDKNPLVVVMDGALGLWRLIAQVLCGIEYVGILDIIHVLEYIWKAGNALYGENNSITRKWVYEKLLSILQGNVGRVIGGLKQRLKKGKFSKKKRKTIEEVIRYFENHKKWMCYDEYLKEGFPIGSGVVESTCGHTVKDRMEGSGRRWSIKGAEAILLLRSIYTSGDWDAYWQSHIKIENKNLYGDINLAIKYIKNINNFNL